VTADEPGASGYQDPLPAWGVGGHLAVGGSAVTARWVSARPRSAEARWRWRSTVPSA
jgi:hypothetical protein